MQFAKCDFYFGVGFTMNPIFQLTGLTAPFASALITTCGAHSTQPIYRNFQV